MFAIVWLEAPALFSLRQITTNAFAARTLPCPTPAALKLALLSYLLGRDSAAPAEEHTGWIAPLQVWWRPPSMTAISGQTITIWKSDRPIDTPGDRLEHSVAYREYASFSEPFGLAISAPDDPHPQDLAEALEHLGALGTRDSLVQVLGPCTWADVPPDGFVELTAEGGGSGDYVALLDDLGPHARFERLNTYRVPDRATVPRLGEDRTRRLVVLPLRVRHRQQGVLLERLLP